MARTTGLAFVIGLSFMLSASYPVREGTEITAVGGGGFYETEQTSSGCSNGSWIIRSRHVDGGLTLRYRPAGSRYYFAGESISGVSNDIQVHEKYADEGAKPELNNTYVGIHGGRVGYQGSWFGVEAGPALVVVPLLGATLPLPAPSAAVRLGGESGLFAYADLLGEPIYLYAPAKVGLGYSGDHARVKISQSSADFDLRLAEHVWLGAAGTYFGAGYFGPQWSAAGKLSFAFYPPPPTAGAR